MTIRRRTVAMLLPAVLAFLWVAFSWAFGQAPEARFGQTFRVPFQTTETNHYLVRVRINGKGPFNFLVDTGAPTLYIATATAKSIGLETPKNSFWAPVDRIAFEGGATLDHVKARVEDPFQLVGMNALGLPGTSIDGILGYTILAKFRIELDPTRDRMVWTRLDFEPRDPPTPKNEAEAQNAPAEVQAMNLIGPLAKFAAFLNGKQPQDKIRYRGILGIELKDDQGKLIVTRILEDAPAHGKLEPGDWIQSINGKTADSIAQARERIARVEPGKPVSISINRRDQRLDLELNPAKGL